MHIERHLGFKFTGQKLRPPMTKRPVLIGVRDHRHNYVRGLYVAFLTQALTQNLVEIPLGSLRSRARRDVNQNSLRRPRNTEPGVLDPEMPSRMFLKYLIPVALRNPKRGNDCAMRCIQEGFQLGCAAAFDNVDSDKRHIKSLELE